MMVEGVEIFVNPYDDNGRLVEPPREERCLIKINTTNIVAVRPSSTHPNRCLVELTTGHVIVMEKAFRHVDF